MSDEKTQNGSPAKNGSGQEAKGKKPGAKAGILKVLMIVLPILILGFLIYALRLSCTPGIKIANPTVAKMLPAGDAKAGENVQFFITARGLDGELKNKLTRPPFDRLKLYELKNAVWNLYLDPKIRSNAGPMNVGANPDKLRRIYGRETTLVSWRDARGKTLDSMAVMKLGFLERIAYNRLVPSRLKKAAGYTTVSFNGVSIHRIQKKDNGGEIVITAMGPYLFAGNKLERMQQVVALAQGKTNANESFNYQLDANKLLKDWKRDGYDVWWINDFKSRQQAALSDIAPVGGIQVSGKEITLRLRKPQVEQKRKVADIKIPARILPRSVNFIAALDDIGMFWDNFMMDPLTRNEARKREAAGKIKEPGQAAPDQPSGPPVLNLRSLCKPAAQATAQESASICTLDWDKDVNPVFELGGMFGIDGVVTLADHTPVPDLFLVYPLKQGKEQQAANVAFRVMFRTIDIYNYEPQLPDGNPARITPDDVENKGASAPMSMTFSPLSPDSSLSPSYLVTKGWLVITLRRELMEKITKTVEGREPSLAQDKIFGDWLKSADAAYDGIVFGSGEKLGPSLADYFKEVTRFSSRDLAKALREVGIPAVERLSEAASITGGYKLNGDIMEVELKAVMNDSKKADKPKETPESKEKTEDKEKAENKEKTENK